MVLASQVRGEEIRALYRQAGAVLGANVVVGAVVAGTLWSDGHEVRVTLWFAAIVVLTLLRVGLQRGYINAAPADSELEPWGRRFVWSSIASGLLWGACGFLFFESGQFASQALLTFAIGGMTAAASGTLSCYLPAFFGFFLLALGPLTARMFIAGDALHIGMGAMMIAYALGMQYVARNNHRSFARAFRLGLENSELVERLSRSQLELEQRVAERTVQLEQQAEALRRAQRLEVVGKLAGSLAHDFNNLLTVVLSNATLLKDAPSGDEHHRAAVDETLQAARRGAGLIRQLLSFSRRQRTEPRVFSMNQLVQGSEAVLRRLAGEAIATSVDLGPEPSLVDADPAQMEQVLVNLVSAACAAMPHGGKLQIETHTVAQAEGGRVVLSVEDSGQRAAQRSLDAAFDPLPASAADALEQTLGLAAARAIIEQAGGTFTVDSERSRGTRFRVELPASRHTATVTPIVGLAPPLQAGATILVVDDEASLRSVIRRTLAREGHQVLLAEDGERALSLARSHEQRIHLLITDVVMPGLSGPELAKLLLPERPDIGVLFISGYSFDAVIPVTDSAEGTGYLAKPFDGSALNAKVRQLLTALERKYPSGLARA
jgi:two-component system, cell cycle sensor histidine kinase and response regulator CckA